MEQAGRVTRLRSKRNRVELFFLPGAGWVVKKDFGENLAGFSAELAMVRRLAAAGVPVAEVIKAEEPVILYRRLPGRSLADLLEEAEKDPALAEELRGGVAALARWLAGYYAASGGLILGDAHLRNFLLSPSGEVAGVDFEACRPGPPEEDIAGLTVFLLTYRPELTPLKGELAGRLLADCRRSLRMDPRRLEEQLEAQLEVIAVRRGKGTVWREEVWKGLRVYETSETSAPSGPSTPEMSSRLPSGNPS